MVGGGPIRFSTTKKVTGIRARLLALDDGSIKAARMNKQRQRSLPTLGTTTSSSKRKSSTKITTRATRTKQSSSSPSTAAITPTASAAVTAVMKLSSATKTTSASTTTITKKAAPAAKSTNNKRKAREYYDDDDDEDYIDEDYVEEEEEKQEEVLLDKVEFSPTGRASCKACRKKIAKGAKRIGVSDYFHRFKSYGYVYYHDRCCPAKVKENLRLENAPTTTTAMKRPKLGTTPANTMKNRINQRIESAYQQQAAIADAKRHTLQHDPLVKDLRIALMALRREFAKRMNLAAKRRNIHNRYTSPAFIFSDDTLDELALQMPQTKQEFLAIPGIGEKKFQSFGDSFLMLISYYHGKKQQGKQQQRSSLSRNRQQPSLQSTTMRARRLRSSASLCIPSSAPAKPNDPEVIIIDDSDDERVDNNSRRTTKEKSKKKQKISREEEEDEDIIVEESLTCEEIVNRKFQHAEENGYVIEI